jgi:hypothetical protein
MGSVIGIDAFHFAEKLFDGTAGTCANGSDNLDSDADGFADGCDSCSLTTPLGGCDCESGYCCREGCMIGDSDGDGIRDLNDFARLQICFSGSTQTLDGSCRLTFDIEEDPNIDWNDFWFFHRLMTGP